MVRQGLCCVGMEVWCNVGLERGNPPAPCDDRKWQHGSLTLRLRKRVEGATELPRQPLFRRARFTARQDPTSGQVATSGQEHMMLSMHNYAYHSYIAGNLVMRQPAADGKNQVGG